jgi:hypothetical protein
MMSELRLAWYMIRFVRPWHWRAFRREVREMQRKLEADLHSMIVAQRVVPFDDEGIQVVADAIAESLRRNLPPL